ncbi:CAP domain-containing protein [Bacillus sp. ISL-40]|uniref:CAP domain-containing protein n=1 Tax=unclassified Bacillus (in: firmicutes) TaxID=185979 RepID=UPI001BEB29D4|nr:MULTISPECIES: CAP domain-containing protein [unclassified Bacillus (in: firmicutes)]MBT2700583.1 CAP domain-containing protein [Bacillus sp. ISL-40]MBT2744147.1 CAP domain-containing protein [Bacillus sp. ISL-77]
MVRLLAIISFILLFYFSLPVIDKQMGKKDIEKKIDSVQSEMNIKDSSAVLETLNSFYEKVQQLVGQLGFQAGENPLTKQQPQPQKEKVELNIPTNQVFSVNNIELGNLKEDIDHNLGKANRSSLNEYGTNWYAYHEDYHDFFMVMYDENNKVAGLYTNQDLIASTKGIKLGSSKIDVRAKLGEPITNIQKGLTVYQLQENSDYDVFLLEGTYVTIFYDKHENNTVTAIQLISKDFEQKKTGFYTKANSALKEGFEYQLFDLTNAARVNHQLTVLTWDEHVRGTARKHSTDMAVHQYFDHTNLKGQSPFDRMKEDDISFHMAGENLAYGQFSSIFAHEGLMNSLGHRENILREGYEFLGVGVAFNDESQPYYTENFFAK